MFGFRNANIYIEGKGIIKSSIQIENGKIKSFEDDVSLKELPDNLIIVPGFIDEHMHGANGSDAMYPHEKDIFNISRSITQDGVTSFLATTMTMPEEEIIESLKNIAKCMDLKNNGANILGIHLEGPFISKMYSGAQAKEAIKSPDVELMNKFYEASNHKIRIVTFAYEENGRDLLRYLINNKIVASMGHTNCSANIAIEGIKNGISCSTHTFNAMKGIHHRDIGTVGAAMISNDVYCEIICDLHHVSEDAIKLLYLTKGLEKIILITDSMEARFLSDGQYKLGGQDVFVSNGKALLKNGTLAGSILHMNDAIRNIKNILNLKLEDAIDLATKNPAKNLKIYDKKGSINIGKDADLAIVDRDLNIYKTFVNGIEVYSK